MDDKEYFQLQALVVVADDEVCSNNEGENQLRTIYLNYHNLVRKGLAKGKYKDLSGRRLGPAKNIHKLSWSCDLAQAAEEIVKDCGYDFSKYQWYGQNRETFYLAYGETNFNVKANIKKALEKWWGQAKNAYIYKDNKYQTTVHEFSNMAHYKNTELGCAHAICNDSFSSKMQVLCVYRRLGSMGDSIMWRDGRYCRTDSSCTIFPNSKCEDGLCIKPKQQPVSPPGDRILVIFSCMLNLTVNPDYNCELEQSSTYHAGFCHFSHSSGDYGENIYTVYTPRFEKRVIAEMATESWFEELEDFGVGKNVKLTEQLFNRYPGQIGHYTQVRNMIGSSVSFHLQSIQLVCDSDDCR
uniref:SCP domain-containing protein n=1 Tax=Angiostrongylus cantonensis TaxID=6313 RepID=A0A0K0DRB4_ANGCA